MASHAPTLSRAGLERLRRFTRRHLAVNAALYLFVSVLYFLPPFPWQVTVPALLAVYASQIIALRRFYARNLELLPGQRPVLPYPLSLQHMLGIQTTFLALFPLIYMSFEFRSNALAALLFLPLMSIGFSLIAVGTGAREPSDPCCPRCAYPTDSLAFPAMCPECAHPLPTAAAATTTPVIRRPRLIWLGITMLLVCVGTGYITIVHRGALMNALPRPALLALALQSDDAFESLMLTTLTPTERDDLIDRILDARPTGERHQLHHQLGWLAEQLESGLLTTAQADRFATEGYSLELVTRTSPVAPESVEVYLTGVTPLHDYGTRFKYFFGGFRADHQPPVLRANRVWDTDKFDFDWLQIGHAADRYTGVDSYDVPFATLRLGRGAHTIRARVIAVTISRFSVVAHTITWHDDGSYTITPPPLTAHELTAETTITIAP